MTSKIDIELKYCPNRCNLSDIELHSAKIVERNSDFNKSGGVFGEFSGMFALYQSYRKSNLNGQKLNRTQNTDIVQHYYELLSYH